MNKKIKSAIIFAGGIVIGFKLGTKVYKESLKILISELKEQETTGIKDVVFESRGEAERVLDILNDYIHLYGFCTVNDYYETCGLHVDYAYSNCGWLNLKSAKVVRVKDGYTIRFPNPLPVK